MLQSEIKSKGQEKTGKVCKQNTKVVKFEDGDPVYYKNNQRKGKVDMKWKTFYKIFERKGPVSYVIKNQLDGTTSKVHAEMLRLANIDDWQVPKTQDNR